MHSERFSFRTLSHTCKDAAATSSVQLGSGANLVSSMGMGKKKVVYGILHGS